MQKAPVSRLLGFLRRHADRGWYAPFIAFCALLDAFILIVPIETLIVPQVALRPKRWITSSLWVATGSAVGALALAMVSNRYGAAFLATHFPRVTDSGAWQYSFHLLQRHGTIALFAIALGPLPQQPVIAIAGLAHDSMLKIFISIWAGRFLKYSLVNWCAAHGVRMLGGFKNKRPKASS